jgi:hypothetical protein
MIMEHADHRRSQCTFYRERTWHKIVGLAAAVIGVVLISI